MMFIIHWKNLDTGQRGVGTKQFGQAEAAAVCRELNTDYPHIEHVAVEANGATPEFRADREQQPTFTPGTFIPLSDTDAMPFGEHAGKMMRHVPSNYLDWLDGQHWLQKQWPALADYVRRSRKSINQDLERSDRE